ncbi:SAM-dependent methyltransferase [Marixanthomonas spongiae]|uniref:SAM-dependent methyltransferase n=1 Tax=Marixanthomonas spongiae TaxID=2174845 RepID=A0A2U0I636_9FLAO|nr:SAM-dependent methyltransferase [Marixanthomonas spongiae]
MKQLIIKAIPSKVRKKIERDAISKFKKTSNFSNISYSQEGEDLILKRFFEGKDNGFYVDVGAHHPKRFSNTYVFYLKGWRGINIDAMPGSMKGFNEQRPRDINVETGVSMEKDELTYYMFNEPALNTFSEKEAKKKDGLRNFKIIAEKKIQTLPLNAILDTHLPTDVGIDFMTIDVEGLDLQVLQSNNWEVYRPNMVLVEDLKKRGLADLITNSAVYDFLTTKNYQLVAKTWNTLFFSDRT